MNESVTLELSRTARTLLGLVWVLSGLCWLGNGNLLMIAVWAALLVGYKRLQRATKTP